MKVGIIGGGLSGLLTSYLLLKMGENVEIFLFEKEKYPGGKIKTEKIDGFLVENGPNGFLNSKPETLEIIKMLGIRDELYEAESSSEKRYILKDGKLIEVPISPLDFIKSPILSFGGKFRILLEIFKGKGEDEFETVKDFVTRRLGKEAYERLIDPMVSGIYAGNPEKMEMKAAFPVIYNLEKDYGGLIRGMIKVKKRKKDVSASPSGKLTTFKGGLYFFIEKLREEILSRGGKIFLNTDVNLVEKLGDKVKVLTSEGSFSFDKVILAIPSYEACRILRKIDERFTEKIEKILYSPLVVVHFGYRKIDFKSVPGGFGFLIPHIEKRKILGSIFISSIFKRGRASQDNFLFTVMMGGARWEDVCTLRDDEIEGIVKDEFREILGIDSEPIFKRVVRWNRAIPQYNVGHSKIMEYAKNFHKKSGNIYISGNCFRGIGINDISKASFEVVSQVLKN